MRIKIDLERNQWSEPFLDNVYDCEHQIVCDNSADIFVKSAHLINEKDLESGKKFIALEKKDGASVLKRGVLKHQSVIRYVKQYKYTDYQLNNLSCVDGRVFTKFLADEADFEDISPKLKRDDCQKIFLGWNFLHYRRMQDFIPINFKLENERSIDVFFAGNVMYGNGNHKGGNLITTHRKNCIDSLNSIKGLNIIAISGRSLSLKDYLSTLLNSKVVVSPWGWGEACYRDYEAILAGCILIKPVTDFVESSCGIFQQSLIFWTTPDFSDLELKIRMALKIFKESIEERNKNSALLVNESHRVKSLIRSILEF